MINPNSRSLKWITEAAQKAGVRDVAFWQSQQVLDDIYQTALTICLRGIENPEEFKLLQDGISRIGSFIHSEKYTLDSAIINAAKVAYLSKLIEKGIDEIKHYVSADIRELSSKVLELPIPTKLNKLKKTHPEAFFYFNEIQLLLQ